MGTRHEARGTRAGVMFSCIVCFMTCAFLIFGKGLPSAVAAPKLPDSPSARSVARYIMGVRHDLLGEQEFAVREYERSVKEDAGVFATRLKLGMSYARLRDYPAAVRELTAAAALDPQDLQAHYFLALIYTSLRDAAKAVGEYEIILKKLAADDPRNAELLVYLAQLYQSQGQTEKALAQYEKVVALDPTNTGAMAIVASYYLDRNRRPEAIDLFKRCIAQDPLDEGCLNSLSYTYAEDGVNLDEAIVLVRRALEIRPDNYAYIDTLGWVYYQKGMYFEALKELSRAIELDKDPVIFDHLGDASLKMKNAEAARSYWKQSLELDPDQLTVRAKLHDLEKTLPVNPKQP